MSSVKFFFSYMKMLANIFSFSLKSSIIFIAYFTKKMSYYMLKF